MREGKGQLSFSLMALVLLPRLHYLYLSVLCTVKQFDCVLSASNVPLVFLNAEPTQLFHVCDDRALIGKCCWMESLGCTCSGLEKKAWFPSNNTTPPHPPLYKTCIMRFWCHDCSLAHGSETDTDTVLRVIFKPLQRKCQWSFPWPLFHLLKCWLWPLNFKSYNHSIKIDRI